MFFMTNRSPEEQSGLFPGGSMVGPWAMMSGCPGPMMMTRMMPWMVGNFLSADAPEARREKLLEAITGLVGQTTTDFSDEEYSSLIDEMEKRLRNREEIIRQTPESCCG